MKTLFLFFLYFLLITISGSALAQSLNGYWDTRFCPCGTNWPVYALAKDSNRIYLGGEYSDPYAWDLTQGKILPQPIIWDGKSWSTLGGGISNSQAPYGFSTLKNILVSGEDIFIVGAFDHAGDKTIHNIARWSKKDSTWYSLPNGILTDPCSEDLSQTVAAIDNNFLYLSGNLAIDGINKCTLARWDRKNEKWDMMLPLNNSNPYGYNLFLDKGMLYVYGNFTMLDTLQCNGIARWNSILNHWEKFESKHAEIELNGNGINSVKAGLGDTIYVAGNFSVGDTTADSSLGSLLLKWDGNNWSSFGNTVILDNQRLGVTLYGDTTHLYLIGNIGLINNTDTIKYFATLEGNSWKQYLSQSHWNSEFPSTFYDYYDGILYGDGNPSTIGRWNGRYFVPLDSGFCHGVNGVINGVNATINDIYLDNDTIYIAGDFTFAGGVKANHVAKWTGSEWEAIGDLPADGPSPHAIIKYNDELYLASDISYDSDSLLQFMRFDGTEWIPTGQYFYGRIRSLAVYKNKLIVGGFYSTIAQDTFNYIAQWDGKNFSHMGSGFSSNSYGTQTCVLSLLAKDSVLYAGGSFLSADRKPAYCLAKWNGFSWSGLTDNPNESIIDTAYSPRVTQLCSEGDTIFMGGAFDWGKTGLAIFDGKHFQQIEYTLPITYGDQITVTAMVLGFNRLYFAGELPVTDPFTPNPVCLVNGNQYSLSDGIQYPDENGKMNVMKFMKDKSLLVGGYFSKAGDTPAQSIAIWHEGTQSVSDKKIENEDLIIYPNPAISSITIKTLSSPSQISITDMLGRKVASFKSQDSEIHFDVSQFPNSIYTCMLENNSGRTGRKFIILK